MKLSTAEPSYYQRNKDKYKGYREKNREKRRLQSKEWHLKNKEHAAEYAKEYTEKNREKINLNLKKYRQQEGIRERHNKQERDRYHNTDYYGRKKKEISERGKKWRLANKDRGAFYSAKRRALTKDLTYDTIQRVYEDNIKKYGTLTCVLCNNPILFGDDSLEHLLPLVRGGTNDYDNLGVAHLKCNLKKNRKTLKEWKEI